MRIIPCTANKRRESRYRLLSASTARKFEAGPDSHKYCCCRNDRPSASSFTAVLLSPDSIAFTFCLFHTITHAWIPQPFIKLTIDPIVLFCFVLFFLARRTKGRGAAGLAQLRRATHAREKHSTQQQLASCRLFLFHSFRSWWRPPPTPYRNAAADGHWEGMLGSGRDSSFCRKDFKKKEENSRVTPCVLSHELST